MNIQSDNSWHMMEVDSVLTEVQASSKGLTDGEADQRLRQYGLNKITDGSVKGLLFFVINQFKSYLVWILIVAAIISLLSQHQVDAYIILAIVLINAIIGVYQEYTADKSIKSLQNSIRDTAIVIRAGHETEIPIEQLVRGDIVLLEEGDQVPADCRLIEVFNLRTSEAPLTGESFPIDKFTEVVSDNTGIGGRNNMVWLGTFVASGTAKGVVVQTGQGTELGKIASDLQSIDSSQSHFEQKAQTLSKQLGVLSILSAGLIFVVGYFVRGESLIDILLFAIAALVSAIPEGLPAVIAITLAIGARRMSKQNAIIRYLPATETLGVVDTICTDKTGTLTQNKMQVNTICFTHDGILKCSELHQACENAPQSIIRDFVIFGEYGNKAKVIKEGNKTQKIGDPTEIALTEMASFMVAKSSLDIGNIEVIRDFPFESNRKMRAAIIKEPGVMRVLVTGAGERLIELSSSHIKQEWLDHIEKLALTGERVLAIGSFVIQSKEELQSLDDIENLEMNGLISMSDPLRDGIVESIDQAKRLGLRTIMMTGDHALTATSIARQIGLLNESESALTQSDIENKKPKEFDRIITTTNVFARLTPSMKLRITKRLQELGHLVAMTGDGVNDAPALKKADVGIAMGITGTDVSRNAASMVLSDDNYSSIIDAVLEGRNVFRNVKKASYFLLSTNFAEIATILVSLFFALPLPLTASLILWLNLVTDGVNGIALAFDMPDESVKTSKPLDKDENILSISVLPYIAVMVCIMVPVTLGSYVYLLNSGESVEYARTVAFLIMAFSQLFNLPNIKSGESSAFSRSIFSNSILNWVVFFSFVMMIVLPYSGIGMALGLESIPIWVMMLTIVVSSLTMFAMELIKVLRKMRNG